MAKKNTPQSSVDSSIPTVVSANRRVFKDYVKAQRAILARRNPTLDYEKAIAALEALGTGVMEFSTLMVADVTKLIPDAVTPEVCAELREKITAAGEALIHKRLTEAEAQKLEEDLEVLEEEFMEKVYPDVNFDELTAEAYARLVRRTLAKSRGEDLKN